MVKGMSTCRSAAVRVAFVLGLLGLMSCAHTRIVPLANREVVALSADDIVTVMRRAGFSDDQILDLGTEVRNTLAASGAAEVRIGNKVEAIFAVRGEQIHISSRRRGNAIYDVGTGRIR